MKKELIENYFNTTLLNNMDYQRRILTKNIQISHSNNILKKRKSGKIWSNTIWTQTIDHMFDDVIQCL